MGWGVSPPHVTPRLDRGVQGHAAPHELVALDSAIKSRNDTWVWEKGVSRCAPSPASLRLDRRVYSQISLPQRAWLRHGRGRECRAQQQMRVGPPVKPEGYVLVGGRTPS
ncbi:hypothetical protein GCM10011587_11330 [Pyruvatibacter mobilis]|nr:hypothetical protein GCM10011587_11330 [Pyruvatibacter mobilis]